MNRQRLIRQLTPVKAGSPLVGWTLNTIRHNAWKVRPLYDEGDLFNEAFLVHAHCDAMYANVRDAKHFAALYRTAFTRRIIALAAEAAKARTCQNVADYVDAVRCKSASEESLWQDMYAKDLEVTAPPTVKRLLGCVEVLKFLGNMPRAWGTTRRHANNRLCRIAGINPTFNDLVGTIERWLGVAVTPE